jgi:hypothetical protein
VHDCVWRSVGDDRDGLSRIGQVGLIEVHRRDVPATGLGVLNDPPPEHPGRPRHEQPQRMSISELSPTMNRYPIG